MAKEKREKRASGEGSWFKTKTGKGYAISYEDPFTHEKGRKYFYGAKKSQILAKVEAWKKELESGALKPDGKITVEEWLKIWLETYTKNRVRLNTYEGYERIVNKHLIPELGHYYLRDLRPEHIQSMLNNKLEKGNLRYKGKPLQARQVEYIYAVLHSALEQAVKNQVIIRNPCDAVTKPKKQKNEFIPWDDDQTNHFLSSVKGSRLFPLYMVAWGTGLRRSEILGLKWEDVDFKKGTLTVRRSLVRVKGGYVIHEPKTKKSRRTIPLPGAVIKALKAWKKKQAAEKVAFHGTYNSYDLVFCNEIGEATNPESISRAFKRDLGRAKLPEIRFHDLRHGHATMLLELGEDITVISNRLGHSTINLTADTYSHVRERLQREASSKLDRILNLKK